MLKVARTLIWLRKCQKASPLCVCTCVCVCARLSLCAPMRSENRSWHNHLSSKNIKLSRHNGIRFWNVKSCRGVKMIEKLSGTPTQKCNLLESSIFNNTVWTWVAVQKAPTSLQPSFTFLPLPHTKPVCDCYYYCSIRERRRRQQGGEGRTGCGQRGPLQAECVFHSNWKLSISHPHNHPPTHTHTHRNTCVMPDVQ